MKHFFKFIILISMVYPIVLFGQDNWHDNYKLSTIDNLINSLRIPFSENDSDKTILFYNGLYDQGYKIEMRYLDSIQLINTIEHNYIEDWAKANVPLASGVFIHKLLFSANNKKYWISIQEPTFSYYKNELIKNDKAYLYIKLVGAIIKEKNIEYIFIANDFQKIYLQNNIRSNSDFSITNIGEHGFCKVNNTLFYKIDLEIKNTTNYKLKNIILCGYLGESINEACNKDNYKEIWVPQSKIKFELILNQKYSTNILDLFDHTPSNLLLSISIKAHNIDQDFDKRIGDFEVLDDWKEYQKVLGLRDILEGEEIKSVMLNKKMNVENEPEEEQSFVTVDENASFQGGDVNTFRIWVQQNMVYPTTAAEAGISGRVIVQFAVNSKGKVCDAKVLRGVHPELDEEAIRCTSSSPVWVPGKQGGKAVKQQFVIPIIFELK